MYNSFINLVRSYYNNTNEFISLHAPVFNGKEREYVIDAIDSTFVSSVGEYVNRLEAMTQEYTGAQKAVATVNGTSALHIALHALGVDSSSEVITQALSFVATANAIKFTGAQPVFLDVDKDTMGLSPKSVRKFLENETVQEKGVTINKKTGKKIAACVPMHTFGFPLRIEELSEICNDYGIFLVEDAAESLGSYYYNKHTGRFGKAGVFSLNGNKTITSGGGGLVITDDVELGNKIKHLTTTAKTPHPWRYYHDQLGFNYRMPNINAALACAQLEQLPDFLNNKRILAKMYRSFFSETDFEFVWEVPNAKANFWLNTVLAPNKEKRDDFLKITNESNVMTRPAWDLLNTLPIYSECATDDLENSIWLADRIVNIPSGVKL